MITCTAHAVLVILPCATRTFPARTHQLDKLDSVFTKQKLITGLLAGPEGREWGSLNLYCLVYWGWNFPHSLPTKGQLVLTSSFSNFQKFRPILMILFPEPSWAELFLGKTIWLEEKWCSNMVPIINLSDCFRRWLQTNEVLTIVLQAAWKVYHFGTHSPQLGLSFDFRWYFWKIPW